jgi:hypothetical protein
VSKQAAGWQAGDAPALDPPLSADGSATATLARLSTRRQKRREAERRRRRRRRLLALLVCVAILLAPAVYSYTTTMLKPSSLPLGVRSVEWLRNNHGNWLVDEAERLYYGWNAPKKGGPQLKSLPALGVAPAVLLGHLHRQASVRRRTAAWPPRIEPVFARPLPREGLWERTGPLVAGRPPVLVTTFRTELAYPRIIAYVAWFDHTRTELAFYPGRYEPPNAPVRGPMSVPRDQRWRLLATFNGGFTYIDGHNGSSIDGRTYEPLRDGLATLIGYRNGRVDIRTWTGGPDAGARTVFARQSLPLIIPERSAQPGPGRQLTVGLHARKLRPRLADRCRRRPARQSDLCRRERPDRDHAGENPAAGGRSAGDAVRHQPRVADADHVRASPQPRSDQDRAERDAAVDALPRSRRP